MARYKLGPEGVYFDEQDTGPDQASAEQIATFQGGQTQAPMEAPEAETYDGPMGSDGPTADKSTQPIANFPQQDELYGKLNTMNTSLYSPGGSEGEGGIGGEGGSGQSQIDSTGAIASPYQAPAAPTAPTGTSADTDAGIRRAYETYLGRDATEKDMQSWRGNANYLQGIQNSPEANYFKNVGVNYTPPGAGSRDPTTGDWISSAPNYAAMEGVDMGKMNDASHTTPKYIAARILASGGTVEQAAAAVGGTVVDATRFRLPTGELIDTRRDEEGANALQWLVMGEGGDSGGAGGAPGGGTGGVGGHGGSGGGEFGGGPINDAIMRLLGRGEGGVSADDPNIAGPTLAFKAQVDRATRGSRNALAERAAASGLNSGGQGSGYMDSAIQSQGEKAGLDVANYEGKLMTDEIAHQREDVINALQFAQGEERMALTQYLAVLNDKLQRSQMGQQNSQFYDTMGYNMGRDQADLDQRMLELLYRS